MKKIGLWLVLLGLLHGGSWAQNADEIISVRILSSVEMLQAGLTQDIALVLTIKEPYHINSGSPLEDFLVPTSITFHEVPGVRYGISEFPQAETRVLSFSDLPLEIYEGTLTVYNTLNLDPSFSGSELRVSGSIQYQACDDNACLPPGELEFQQVLLVAGAVSYTHLRAHET